MYFDPGGYVRGSWSSIGVHTRSGSVGVHVREVQDGYVTVISQLTASMTRAKASNHLATTPSKESVKGKLLPTSSMGVSSHKSASCKSCMYQRWKNKSYL